MDLNRFTQLVARLEAESAQSPLGYRLRVAALALLGFGILALLFGAVGIGLLVLAGIALALLFSGGGAALLLLKLGKLLLFLAIPLWYLVKSGVQALFVRLPAPQGRAITRADAPPLFDALGHLRKRLRGPRFHQVLVVDGVNAAVVQRPAFGLVGWPRNHLLLGLPLLEALPPDEALAVVAHEYGHLAGSHGHFSAFIYRLRHTWGTVQAFTDHIQGWLGRVVAPLVRWYVPYFNAYTFVLARADEYQADAAAADLVGAGPAADALKRVQLAAAAHGRFLERTFEGIPRQPAPPADLMQRWAATATAPLPDSDAAHWLGMALDRTGQVTDTHPSLRARLAALAVGDVAAQQPPAALAGPSAAQAWLGPLADTLRTEFQRRWADEMAEPWAERHTEALAQRERLATLRAQASRSMDEDLEQIRLALRLEPEQDHRPALAAFNAAHADHAPGLFLEGAARLEHGDETGLALLERACALDPDAIKPASERAHTWLLQQRRPAEAERQAERWRARDAFEALRRQQTETLEPADRFAPHGLPADVMATVQQLLAGPARASIAELYLARRQIAVDPSVQQWVLAVRLGWWARRRGRHTEVLQRLAGLDWPVPLLVVSLDGRLSRWRRALRALGNARLA